MTSNDLKRSQSISEPSLQIKHAKSKNKLKGGGKIENNDEKLDEILHINNS